MAFHRGLLTVKLPHSILRALLRPLVVAVVCIGFLGCDTPDSTTDDEPVAEAAAEPDTVERRSGPTASDQPMSAQPTDHVETGDRDEPTAANEEVGSEVEGAPGEESSEHTVVDNVHDFPAIRDSDISESELSRRWFPRSRSERDDDFLNAQNAFALTLLRDFRASAPRDNLVFSPYSISLVLAAVHAGAVGDSADQIQQALAGDSDRDQLHDALATLHRWILSRQRRQVLSLAAAVWTDERYPTSEEFQDSLTSQYGFHAESLPFAQDEPRARRSINSWIEERTGGVFSEFLPAGTIDPSTRMVMASAMYFLAKWQNPFDADDTTTSSFRRLDESSVDVEMMHREASFDYGESSEAQVVRLPYKAPGLAMLLILPRNGLPEFEENLTADQFHRLSTVLSRREGKIGVPQFELMSSPSLKPALENQGIEAIFDPDTAGLDAISAESGLHVDNPIHQAYIAVDEEGTEAAAVTAAGLVGGGGTLRDEPFEMILDRPFLFAIQETTTDTILMMGSVVDPTSR